MATFRGASPPKITQLADRAVALYVPYPYRCANKKKPASRGLRFNVMPILKSNLQPVLSARCGVGGPTLSAQCLQNDPRMWCYKGEVIDNFTTERSIAQYFVQRTKYCAKAG